MAKMTIEDLTTPMTREEVQASIYKVLASLGVNTTAWLSGSVVRTMVVGCSLVMSAFTYLAADIGKSGFLALSSGPWLTLVAQYVYGLERIEASYASGVVTLTNAGGGVYTVDEGDLILASSSSGHTYRNIAAFSLPPVSSADVSIVATDPGAASTAPAGDITVFVTPLLGVIAVNENAVTGENDESDEALRLRCAQQLGAISPMGPWDAYGSALRNAKRPDGTSLGITRIRLIADGFGRVFVYCATAGGEVPPADLPYADEAVQQWAAPQAITAIVLSATGVDLDVSAEVFMYNTSGLSPAEIEAKLDAAVIAYANTQPVGGNLGVVYADAVRAAVFDAMREIYHVAMTVPAADISLAVSEVLTAGATTWTITQVPPPQGYHP